MTPSSALPLVFAVLLTVSVALSRVHGGVDRGLTGTAVGLFGRSVERSRGDRPDRQAALRAAKFPTTYRVYGSKTILFAGLFGVVGSLLGIYVAWGIVEVVALGPDALGEHLPGPIEFLAFVGTLPEPTTTGVFALSVLTCLTTGTLAGGGTYALRWWYPGYVADARARRIEATLPATIAFVHALSRSGMSVPEVIRIVAAREDVYGEAAAEFAVAVRAMDTFGTDVVTALQTMGRRTPSADLGEFTESFVSVLQSGHSLSSFLERQYHDAREESESQQERLLESLSTLAEAYVTVLIAGPLFLITLLVVIGISIQDTETPLAAVIYVVVPLGNLAFVVYVGVVTDAIDPGVATASEPPTIGPALDGEPRTDGGAAVGADAGASAGSDAGRSTRNLERVRWHRRLRSIADRLGSPLETLLERPLLTVAITGPIATAVVAWSLFDPAAPVRVDDAVAAAAVLVLVVFAAFYERRQWWIDAVEAAIPDLLDRLASVNEAGMSLVSGIDHVRDSDLGPLGAELDRVWNDVQWGADVETALRRLDARVRTRTTSRAVALLTEAMKASGDLATVLRIAARQAATDRRLKRRRIQAMREYLVVVYVSFLVFLLIIGVLAAYLFPNLPTGGGEAVGDIGGIGDVQDVDTGAYTTLFYHATLIQGAMSGLIAGQLSTGQLRAGAKHAAVLIALSIVLFAVLV